MTFKLKARINFPATVTATGGIKVVKANGIWTISPDFAGLTSLPASSVQDPTTQEIWIFNPADNSYAVLTLAGLGDALFKLTSTTSNSVGTGSKIFATQTNKDVGVGQYVIITDDAAPSTNYMNGQITAYDSSGNLTVNVTGTGGSGTKTAWTIRVSGSAGATGSQGNTAGFNYTFNSATSGDPGSGKFLFNNATFGSATSMNISETDADSNGLATLLATLDDSTSTNKCLAVFTKTGGVALFVAYITGTLTDNGAYDTFSITPVLTTGSISNADSFRAQFFRVGDKGLDGTIAGSTGATDNRILRADGTGGSTVQNSQVTIDDSGNMSGTNTIELGNVTDTTLTRASPGILAVEGANLYPNAALTSKSVAYTTVLGDANAGFLHPSADTTARIWTIDSNANVAYPVNTTLMFVNQHSAGIITISITSDTLRLAGAGTTGSRTLAADGVAVAVKLTSTEWIIWGVGLT